MSSALTMWRASVRCIATFQPAAKNDSSWPCEPQSPITPANRWLRPVSRLAPLHARELMGTARVQRADELRALPRAARPFELPSDVAALMREDACDGLLVLHDAEIVIEKYAPTMNSRQTHVLNSASKVAVACVVGALVGQGKLALERPLAAFVPSLQKTGYEHVTVQQALDMRSGVPLHADDDFFRRGSTSAAGQSTSHRHSPAGSDAAPSAIV